MVKKHVAEGRLHYALCAFSCCCFCLMGFIAGFEGTYIANSCGTSNSKGSRISHGLYSKCSLFMLIILVNKFEVIGLYFFEVSNRVLRLTPIVEAFKRRMHTSPVVSVWRSTPKPRCVISIFLLCL